MMKNVIWGIYSIIVAVLICLAMTGISGWLLFAIILAAIIGMIIGALVLFEIIDNIFFETLIKSSITNLSIFISIAGICITGFYDVFSQYKYEEWKEPIRHLYSDNYKTIGWDTLINKTNPITNIDFHNDTIVFLLDVSKSLKNIPINTEKKLLLENSINKASGWCDFINGYKCKNTAMDIVKARLCCLLHDELYKGSIKGVFTILKFSNNVSVWDKANIEIEGNNLHNMFDEILSPDFNFDGKKTYFDNLLDHLINNYCLESNSDFKRSTKTFVFLSDYFHDIKIDSETDKKNLKEQLDILVEHNIFSNVLFLDISVQQPDETLDVKKLLEEVVPDFNKKNISMFNNDHILLSRQETEKPIRFYYRSYLYEKELETFISFEKKDDIDIRINYNGNDRNFRQEFFGNEKRLSHNNKKIPLKNNELHLTMKGHIPFQYPYSNAELVVNDNKQEYYAKIVFFKELPEFLKWTIPLYFGLLTLFSILLFCPIDD